MAGSARRTPRFTSQQRDKLRIVTDMQRVTLILRFIVDQDTAYVIFRILLTVDYVTSAAKSPSVASVRPINCNQHR